MNEYDSIEILKALADETRLGIVRKLARERGAAKSCDICACSSVTQLSQPAMSHHFAKLVDAGVLQEHKDGTEKSYRLNKKLLKSIGIDTKKL